MGDLNFRVATRASLSDARIRLGAQPLQQLHEELATPLEDQSLPGSYFKNWLIVAIDESTLALQDTAENAAEFGRASNQNGPSAWPLTRFVALVECGTHLIFAASQGGYCDSEITLAKALVPRLRPGMLCLADRLFPGSELWKEAAATGSHQLWRAKVSVKLKKIQTLADGSWLAEWLPEAARKKAGNRCKSASSNTSSRI